MKRAFIRYISNHSFAPVAFLTFLFSILCFFILPFNAQAIELTDQYSVEVTTTELDTNSFRFQYTVTNINQQAPELPWTGLGGFRIAIPAEATISNIEVPDPYYADTNGFWTGNLMNGFLVFNGNYAGSIYPPNETARFSFQADGVQVGNTVNAVLITYWDTYNEAPGNFEGPNNPGQYYTFYETILEGPIGVPLPVPKSLISTFDHGVEGWGIYGDGIGPYHSKDNGVIYAIDRAEGNNWYFISPSVWAEHDWTKYIGGTIDWDINVFYADGEIYSGIPDVTIIGNISDERIRAFNINVPEVSTWTPFSIKLILENFVDINNEPITADHFYRVMSSFERLYIRGEYIYGYDKAAIDNVKVSPGAISLLQDAITEINELPPSSLKNGNMTNAFNNKINKVLDMIDEGLYENAIKKLKNDILKKTNGCATSGAPDRNDWIKDCEAQEEIYNLIMETIEMLENMI